jgi:hypothetical protein
MERLVLLLTTCEQNSRSSGCGNRSLKGVQTLLRRFLIENNNRATSRTALVLRR